MTGDLSWFLSHIWLFCPFCSCLLPLFIHPPDVPRHASLSQSPDHLVPSAHLPHIPNHRSSLSSYIPVSLSHIKLPAYIQVPFPQWVVRLLFLFIVYILSTSGFACLHVTCSCLSALVFTVSSVGYFTSPLLNIPCVTTLLKSLENLVSFQCVFH